MTNELGHQLARAAGDEMTLGAYRRGTRISWIPGALIDSWVACPRGEHVTGVPSPHVYFKQTRGESSADAGSIHCPACRAELAAARATGVTAAKPAKPLPPATGESAIVKPSPATSAQPTLPF